MKPLAQNWILQIFLMELAGNMSLIRKVGNTEVFVPLSSMLGTYCVVIAHACYFVLYILDLHNMNWFVCLDGTIYFINAVRVPFCFTRFVNQLPNITHCLKQIS